MINLLIGIGIFLSAGGNYNKLMGKDVKSSSYKPGYAFEIGVRPVENIYTTISFMGGTLNMGDSTFKYYGPCIKYSYIFNLTGPFSIIANGNVGLYRWQIEYNDRVVKATVPSPNPPYYSVNDMEGINLGTGGGLGFQYSLGKILIRVTYNGIFLFNEYRKKFGENDHSEWIQSANIFFGYSG